MTQEQDVIDFLSSTCNENESIADDQSEDNDDGRLPNSDDHIDYHSFFTVSEDHSSFYADFSESSGERQDMYSLGLLNEDSCHNEEVFRFTAATMAVVNTSRGRELVELASEDVDVLPSALTSLPSGQIRWTSVGGRRGISGIIPEDDPRTREAQEKFQDASLETINGTHQTQKPISNSIAAIGRRFGKKLFCRNISGSRLLFICTWQRSATGIRNSHWTSTLSQKKGWRYRFHRWVESHYGKRQFSLPHELLLGKF